VTTTTHDALPPRDGAALVITDLDQGSRNYSSQGARDWVRLLRDRYLAPVFVITGHAEAMGDHALQVEAIDIMSKPIDIEDLSARLKFAFEGALR
jgi:DNA-binding LytR/AlgR family response regulator